MRWLETKIPPPLVVILLGAAGFAAARVFPGLDFEFPLRAPVALLLAAVGLGLNLLPKLAFGRAGTTVNPLRPASATSLVTSGIYRRTRNPMYLGHAVIVLAWVLYLGNLAALAAIPVFVLYVTRFQILPEERALSGRFPEAYAEYCRKTPRWL